MYMFLQHHNGTIIKQTHAIIKTQEDFFRKIYTSYYICKGTKGLLNGCVWEGAGDRTELQYFDPHSYGRHVVSFLFSGYSTGGPGPTLLGDGFLYCILSASSLDPNSSWPPAPSAWCGFLYHISTPTGCNSTGSSNSTELYNRSTPTWSLKSNV